MDCGLTLATASTCSSRIRVVVEIKAVESLAPIHRAQVLTYLKLRQCPVGLLLNFNVPVLKDGIVRIVNASLVRTIEPSE